MDTSAKDFSSTYPVDNSVQTVYVTGNEIDIEDTKSQTVVIGTTSSPKQGASNANQRSFVDNSQQYTEVTNNKISIKGLTAEVVSIGVTGMKRNPN